MSYIYIYIYIYIERERERERESFHGKTEKCKGLTIIWGTAKTYFFAYCIFTDETRSE